MNKTLLVKKHGKTVPEMTQDIPPEGIISVGSDASATIELGGENVAPEQFVIVCEGGQLTLLCREDVIEINGNSISKGSLYNLELHDTVIVGDYSLTIETAELAERAVSGETASISPESEIAAAEMPEPIESETRSTAGSGLPEPVENGPFERDKSLSDVLESLKAEEKFYFLIENGNYEQRRIYIEAEDMWLGWAATGECQISEDPADIAKPRGQIRKDWSGVVLYPLKNKNIWLNDAALGEPKRLKNDDRLQMLGREKAMPDTTTSIRFHEPTALLVLDSILPKELPPPVSLDKNSAPANALNQNRSPLSEQETRFGTLTAETLDRKFFGYFTGLEILIMIIGILVAAGLIFLVLEYY